VLASAVLATLSVRWYALAAGGGMLVLGGLVGLRMTRSRG
jgi:hypothetical protein